MNSQGDPVDPVERDLHVLAQRGGPRREGAFAQASALRALLDEAGRPVTLDSLLEVTDRASLRLTPELREVYRAAFRRPPYDGPLLEDRLDACAAALADQALRQRQRSGVSADVPPKSARTMARRKAEALAHLAGLIRDLLEEPDRREPVAPHEERTLPGDRSEFVGDNTIPDGQLVRPGELLDKRWTLRNAGSVPWIGRYLTRIGANTGPETPDRVPIDDTQPGETVTISVPVRCPDRPGTYQVHWKMTDAAGRLYFPDRYFQGIWFNIVVVGRN